LEFGAAIALVIAAASGAVFIFQRVHQASHTVAHDSVHTPAQPGAEGLGE
jgi:hypothetical protein